MNNYIQNFSLKAYNTFGFEVATKYWATFDDDQELIAIIDYCTKNSLKWVVLGGGSNVIFANDFDGMIIHATSTGIKRDGNLIIADAGIVWDDFVAWTVREGLGGIENLSYIPGSVGAAPVQNVGAYGAEAKDCVEWVEYLDVESRKIVRIPNSECEFEYRNSILKKSLKGKTIVVRVAFKLNPNPEEFNINYGDVKSEVEKLGGASLDNIREAIIKIRSTKLPDPRETGNAGSFFKNPVVDTDLANNLSSQYPDMPRYTVAKGVKIPAGWLIEQSGWKGYRVGDAGVHPKQALVLVNYGDATPSDILALADSISADVAQKFGIVLEKEVNIW